MLKSLLPLLPLRDIVVFTNMVAPLFVGREQSVNALNHVMTSDKKIFLLSQKNSKVDNPDRENLYKFRVSKEINRYTGKIKDFNKILFIENIILDPSQSSSLLDSNLSSIIISKIDGTKMICSEIYPNY